MGKLQAGVLITVLALASADAMSMEEKIVYHLLALHSDTFKKAINNIENLKKGMSDRKTDIKIIMQGQSIQILLPAPKNRALMSRLIQLTESGGVDIELSRDNYQAHQARIEKRIHPRLVDNIFSRIVELQKQGYRYITP